VRGAEQRTGEGQGGGPPPQPPSQPAANASGTAV